MPGKTKSTRLTALQSCICTSWPEFQVITKYLTLAVQVSYLSNIQTLIENTTKTLNMVSWFFPQSVYFPLVLTAVISFHTSFLDKNQRALSPTWTIIINALISLPPPIMPGLCAENMLFSLKCLKVFIQENHELTCEPLVQVSPADRQWDSIQGCTCQDQI